MADENEALICTGRLTISAARRDRGVDALHNLCCYELSWLNGKKTERPRKGQRDRENVRVGPRRGSRANDAQHAFRRATQSVKHHNELVARLSLHKYLVRHFLPP